MTNLCALMEYADMKRTLIAVHHHRAYHSLGKMMATMIVQTLAMKVYTQLRYYIHYLGNVNLYILIKKQIKLI